jgi:uncharacterized C2H2 Zn-finger protein
MIPPVEHKKYTEYFVKCPQCENEYTITKTYDKNGNELIKTIFDNQHLLDTIEKEGKQK